MKATEAKFLEFLKKSPQFVIPIYQRTYSWTERECRQLWDDIVRTGSNDAVSAHFVGSIVYIEKGLYQLESALSVLQRIQQVVRITGGRWKWVLARKGTAPISTASCGTT